MITKLDSGQEAAASGAATVIANGKSGARCCASRPAKRNARSSTPSARSAQGAGRKHWLAFTARPRGDLVLDDDGGRGSVAQARSLAAPGRRHRTCAAKFGIGDPVRMRRCARAPKWRAVSPPYAARRIARTQAASQRGRITAGA
jgi:glutamate 5-kinase